MTLRSERESCSFGSATIVEWADLRYLGLGSPRHRAALMLKSMVVLVSVVQDEKQSAWPVHPRPRCQRLSGVTVLELGRDCLEGGMT